MHSILVPKPQWVWYKYKMTHGMQSIPMESIYLNDIGQAI